MKDQLAKSNVSTIPQASITSSTSSNKQSATAHCLDFPEGETDKFFIGAEDFNIYQCNLHSESKNHVEKLL